MSNKNLEKGWEIGHRRGPANPNWKGGKTKTSNGYIKIKKYDHPRAEPNRGYIFEHILVAEEKIGRYLESDEVVHHINFIKDDNCPENLHVCTRSEHQIKIKKSLFNIVDELLKSNIIEFIEGEYKIV